LKTLILMVPLSARADETQAAMTATKATSALRNLNERILFPLIFEAASVVHPQTVLHRLRRGAKKSDASCLRRLL